MKKTFRITLLLSSLCLLLIFSINAQVNFESFSSFEKMLSQAKKDNKLAFVQIESKDCWQCNDVAQKGLSSTALKEKFAVNFVSTFIKRDDAFYKQMLIKTDLSELSMGSLLFDADGYLLLKITSTTSNSMAYLEYADRAISLSKNNVLKNLTTQYQKGEKDSKFLKRLIEEKNKVDFDTHSLVDEFIDSQSMKELSTLENAKLIVEQGLPLESKGRKLLYALFPNKTIDSIFAAHTLQERVKINNKIITSTRKIAVINNDKNLGYQLSNFMTKTYDNWEKGAFSSQSFLLKFYRDILDTTSYLRTAESFANYNLMTLSTDTLKRRNDRERNAVFEQKRKEQNGSSSMSFSYAPFYMKYGEELNNTAYGVFTYTNDLEKLAKALKWSKRAMEINEALVPDESRKQNPYFMDTYACLLYRLGKKEEAIETQTKAIEILKSRNENTSNLETTLTKIKNGTL